MALDVVDGARCRCRLRIGRRLRHTSEYPTDMEQAKSSITRSFGSYLFIVDNIGAALEERLQSPMHVIGVNRAHGTTRVSGKGGCMRELPI